MTIARFCIVNKMEEFRNSRPENIRPKMSRTDRAKQFAPFAALGRMEELLKAVQEGHDCGDAEYIPELSDIDDMCFETDSRPGSENCHQDRYGYR